MKTIQFIFLTIGFFSFIGCGQGQNVLSIAFHYKNPKIMYVGTTGGGLYKSANGGSAFQKIGRGLSSYNISSIAVNPSIPTLIYAGTFGDRLYRSIDSGRNWIISAKGLDDNVGTQAINTIVVDPDVAETIYIGTNHGIYRTVDGGGEWQAANMGIGNRYAIALALDPLNHRMMLAGTNAGIFKTVDAAKTWALVSPETKSWSVNTIVFGKATATTFADVMIYAGTNKGVFKSDDQGMTWRSSDGGNLTAFVMTIAVDPVRPEVLYAANNHGIYKTEDRADHWHYLSESPRSVTTLVIHPEDRDRLFAGTTDGLYLSPNSGKDWGKIQLPS